MKSFTTRLREFIESLRLPFHFEDNLHYRDYIYRLIDPNLSKIDFYIGISKKIDDARIEIQIANPYSKQQDDYLIVGEFYDIDETDFIEICNIIKAILSNGISVILYELYGSLKRSTYQYGYYKDEVIIKSETFRHSLILPWEKNKINKNQIVFDPWLLTDFTIERY